MNKIIISKMIYSIIFVIVYIIMSAMFIDTAYSAVSCDKMIIQSTGTTPYTESGLFVKVKPITDNACGPAGVAKQFFLSTENTNETYATILTAFSLDKTLFIQVSEEIENSLLLVVSIQKE